MIIKAFYIKWAVKQTVFSAGCGPKVRSTRPDHSVPEKYVVPKQEAQDQTTVLRKNMRSQSKKSRIRPQRPGKACGPKIRKARPDHSALEKHVVPKQEMPKPGQKKLIPAVALPRKSRYNCAENLDGDSKWYIYSLEEFLKLNKII